jgi:hypothetical protein
VRETRDPGQLRWSLRGSGSGSSPAQVRRAAAGMTPSGWVGRHGESA